LRRLPSEIPSADGQQAVEVDLLALLQPTTIASLEELDVWLDALKARLEEALEAGKPIRIRLSAR
jgi:hypothetical protein